MFSKGYDGPARSARQIAHTISDALHLERRNLRGVARTKLAFVSDRDRERAEGVARAARRQARLHLRLRRRQSAADHREPVAEPESIVVARRAHAGLHAYSLTSADIVLSRIYDGLPLLRPARGIGNNYLPVFSPDGTRIAFMSTRDGQAEIYVVNVDGSNLRRLTNHPWTTSPPPGRRRAPRSRSRRREPADRRSTS